MNRRTLLSGIAAIALLPIAATAGDTPKEASAILSAAYKEAKATRKPVFLVFDASW